MFTSEGQAKRFFVDKITVQAKTEGVPLSDAERQMLSFSESDPVPSRGLVEKLQAEMSDEEYEAKVAGLIERAWKRDVEAETTARDAYREAFTVLSQGDHYLLVMIQRALRRHVRPWWAFWR